jgi:hypothetical protein
MLQLAIFVRYANCRTRAGLRGFLKARIPLKRTLVSSRNAGFRHFCTSLQIISQQLRLMGERAKNAQNFFKA